MDVDRHLQIALSRSGVEQEPFSGVTGQVRRRGGVLCVAADGDAGISIGIIVVPGLASCRGRRSSRSQHVGGRLLLRAEIMLKEKSLSVDEATARRRCVTLAAAPTTGSRRRRHSRPDTSMAIGRPLRLLRQHLDGVLKRCQ